MVIGLRMRRLLFGCLWLKFGRLALLVVVPVDPQFLFAVENSIPAGPTKIVPGPFHKGFDSGAGGGEQGCVHSEPRSESDCTLDLKSMLSHFGYARVAPDDCHDAFVQIVERGLRLTRNFQQNIFGAPLAGLFCDRGQLRQW